MCASVRHSVRLSVTFVDQGHIGCKSWKLIARTITPTPSLFVSLRTRGIWGKSEETKGESLGKVVCWSTKAAISLMRKDSGKVTAYRTHQRHWSLFSTYWRYTNKINIIIIIINAFSNGSIPDPLRPSLPEDCALKLPPKTLNQSLLGLPQERVKVWTSNFIRTVMWSIRTQVH